MGEANLLREKLLAMERQLIDEIDQGYWKFHFTSTTKGKPRLADREVYKKLQNIQILLGYLILPRQVSFEEWTNKKGFILPESYIKNVKNALDEGINIPEKAYKSYLALLKEHQPIMAEVQG